MSVQKQNSFFTDIAAPVHPYCTGKIQYRTGNTTCSGTCTGNGTNTVLQQKETIFLDEVFKFFSECWGGRTVTFFKKNTKARWPFNSFVLLKNT